MPNDEPPKVVSLHGGPIEQKETVPPEVTAVVDELIRLMSDPTVRGFAYVTIHEDGQLTTSSRHHDNYGWALAGGLTRILWRINKSTDEKMGNNSGP